VGNGSALPITHTGSGSVSTTSSPLLLNNVLISPALIKNLISVHALTRDNNISIEFDKFGFSIKDPHTKSVILCSDSDGDLYPLHRTMSTSSHSLTAITADLWHERLGHPGRDSFQRLLSSSSFTCNKELSHTCHACRFGSTFGYHLHLLLPRQ
jgi:hypothetical protein